MPATTSLSELADRALITDTLHAYCDYVDTCLIDALVDLFTEDTVLDMGNEVIFSGRTAVRELLLDRLGSWAATHHLSSNVRFVGYEGDEATTISYIYAYHESPHEHRSMHLWGRYLDDLRKESGVWRIRRRRLRVAAVRYGAAEMIPERFQTFVRHELPAT